MPFEFTPDCIKVLKLLREALTVTSIICAPNWSERFELVCDAFDFLISVVLGQHIEKQPHVIYCSNRTFNDAWLNYFTRKKDFHTVIFALEKFYLY